MIDLVHRKNNLYSDIRTERTVCGESGSETGPEQGIPAPQNELENLYAALRNSVFIADPSDCFFCHFPVYPHVLYSAGV